MRALGFCGLCEFNATWAEAVVLVALGYHGPDGVLAGVQWVANKYNRCQRREPVVPAYNERPCHADRGCFRPLNRAVGVLYLRFLDAVTCGRVARPKISSLTKAKKSHGQIFNGERQLEGEGRHVAGYYNFALIRINGYFSPVSDCHLPFKSLHYRSETNSNRGSTKPD